jgi:hypothetical protein
MVKLPRSTRVMEAIEQDADDSEWWWSYIQKAEDEIDFKFVFTWI